MTESPASIMDLVDIHVGQTKKTFFVYNNFCIGIRGYMRAEVIMNSYTELIYTCNQKKNKNKTKS